MKRFEPEQTMKQFEDMNEVEREFMWMDYTLVSKATLEKLLQLVKDQAAHSLQLQELNAQLLDGYKTVYNLAKDLV
jgi:hypothetical protein